MRYEKPEPGKPILVEIGGKLVELRFTLKTLKALDTDQQISVMRGDGLSGAFTDPERLAIVLYYGLRSTQPDITLDWVEENVDASMLIDLAPVLAYATTGRWPDVEKLIEAQSPNATRPGQTGSPSGPSADTTSASANATSGG